MEGLSSLRPFAMGAVELQWCGAHLHRRRRYERLQVVLHGCSVESSAPACYGFEVATRVWWVGRVS